MSVKWETRECAGCGKPLTRKPSQFRSERAYCGPRCKSTHAPYIRQQSKKDTQPCPNCGTPVTRYLSVIKAGGGWACSRSCAHRLIGLQRVREGTWLQPKKPRTGSMAHCMACGSEFYQGPKEHRKYCSVACHNVGQTKEKVVVNCLLCGEALTVQASANRKYCSMECHVTARTKGATGRFYNGKPIIRNYHGYTTAYEPEHPSANRDGRVFEHRLVVEKSIGRYLRTEEQVDHINGQKDDNRLENLQVLSASAHAKKSNGEQKAKLEKLLLEELQEYRRRFGALE